ncbi:MAG TPA: type II toxin-antitoxin system death-on-curing family toxin [Bacteroidia bacterium]|nr:type II toxin-antitoxin system death-on-curing family toxin [Bacteroidia bacterium]
MIVVKEALKIQGILIEQFGGKSGVRDLGALESAINRPYATFNSVELYPKPIDKAAAIIESIIVNHPFVDGNKRVGYVLMRLLLLEKGYDIRATEDEKYSFVIGIALGELKTDDIRKWLEAHTLSKK